MTRAGGSRHHDPMGADDGYLLANRQSGAARRLAALSALFDASTFRHLRALGLGPGRHVWEVGAGGPAVPEALADQVAPDGEVLATDLDPAWLPAPGRRNLRVEASDVGLDPPPVGPFDLVHARLVLVHVPERDRALAAMVSVLRPGGWLVVEEADPGLQPLTCLEDRGPAEQLANRLKDGFRRLMADRGVDLAYGRTLPRRLREAGLSEVGADAYFPIAGPACWELEEATIEQIRDRLTVQASHAIVAIPPTLAARIQYDPALPAARDHYTQRSPQGALIKVEAFYDTPFWRDAGLTGAVVSDTGPAKICYDVSPADNALGGLLGFVGGDEARKWGTNHDGLKSAVVSQFVTFFGPQAAAPREVVVQDWNDEVWSRGAPVNLLGPGALTEDRGAIWAPVGRVHWAGTETATYWHGYMDGAITSGQRAAQEVLHS